MFMSPTILCILAYLGMVVDALSRGSSPWALTSGQMCAVFWLMAISLPLVQANHDLAVELLDSEAPIASRRQPEESSGALVGASVDKARTRVEEADQTRELCKVANDLIAQGYHDVVNSTIYEQCGSIDAQEPGQVEAHTTIPQSELVGVEDTNPRATKRSALTTRNTSFVSHDLAVELLDSKAPIASHWRKENTSSPSDEQVGLWRAMQEVSACSTGMYRPTALDSCTVCEAGTFDDDNDASTPCVSCEHGTSSLPGATECPFVEPQRDMAAYEFPPFLSTLLERSDQSLSVTSGDFNGDGMLDALVANSGQANELLLNDGAGGFTSTLLERSDVSVSVTTGDFN
eukprot:COSAG02_NODE_10062_length_2035_cov_4.050620_2_plen_345_part_01